METKFALWDFDKTLVLAERADESSEDVENDEGFGWRHGVREALAAMVGEKRKYSHVITSASSTSRILKLLEMTDFEAYFPSFHVFGAEFVQGNGGKDYDKVRRELKLTRGEAAARMVVIGDDQFDDERKFGQDMPYNLPILFIKQPYGYRYDAQTVNLILQHLEHRNPENLTAAFRKTLDENRRVKLDGLEFSLDFVENRGIVVPVVHEIYADPEKYKKPIIPFD